ncbi:MAG: DPP IV N-terminal domain-containing protein [Candidatus Delongbacteria bacterium]|nr:DPP IV N-terminal domain-containing protein [Candidatus Delongbacteria bacterium]MBN2834642.1 DPP IV N-terminal domain-containing protein [Candidatus Delongbacteria bacterium]
MSKLSKLGLVFVVLFSTFLFSKNEPITKADYRKAERFSPKQLRKMVFSTYVAPNWLKTGNKFWYKYKTTNGEYYYLVDPEKGRKELLFDNNYFASVLTELTKDPYDAQHLPNIEPDFNEEGTKFTFDVQSKLEIEKVTKDSVVSDTLSTDSLKTKKKEYENKTFHFVYDLKKKKLEEDKDWKEEPKSLDWANIAPDSSKVVFSRNFNLYWMNKEDYYKAIKDEKDSTIVENQITYKGVLEYSFGDGYSPNENDDLETIEKESKKRLGAWIEWSQDSKKISLGRRDYRDVKNLWVINSLSEPRPTLKKYKYTMPGELVESEEELWIYNFENDSLDSLDIRKYTNQFFSVKQYRRDLKESLEKHKPAIWASKDSDILYISRTGRGAKESDFCRVDLITKEIDVLIKEETNTYLNNGPTVLLKNEKEIIHSSERDGWMHFYLYDTKGNLKNRITSGPWNCNEIEAIDEENRVLYFNANGIEEGVDPYYRFLYKVNFDGSNLQCLNSGNYTTYANMSQNKKYFVNNYSRVDLCPVADLRDRNGDIIMNLEKADLSSLFNSGYKFPEKFKVKADDGITDLYGVMYKPFDFDSTKAYPIIEYVYPGPQTESVNTWFSKYMNDNERLAQLGFIVITIGNRGGSPDRSKWYHNYGYGDLRDYGLADKKYAIEQLADRFDFIDIDKVGITGHSGGGFMSTAALLQYPDFFKVAVSSAGNHENNIYNNWWSETHHGVKEKENDNGEKELVYTIEKNSEIAKNLKGNLLLVSGDIDDNVHPANTIRVANALIKANKRFDMFFMPGQDHGFGEFTEYFFWLTADYFCKHLIGDSSVSTDIFEMNREKMSSDR